MGQPDVLVIGAGPTGMVLALWLTNQGVKVRIVDKNAEPGTTSRALAVQARTLELYRQLDLADAVVEQGHKVPAVCLWVRGKQEGRVPLETVGADLTPYAFLQIFPQDQHERLLIERLRLHGVSVERQTELTHFNDGGARVTACLRKPDGSEEVCETSYLAGCDGGHSIVREILALAEPTGDSQSLERYFADRQIQPIVRA